MNGQITHRLIRNAFVIKHLAGKHNQKTHANKYGAGQAKESLRRLKDDKGARERYKAKARKQNKQTATGSTDTMTGFESSIAKTNVEHAAVFKNEEKLFDTTSNKETTVTFTDDQIDLMKDAVITHNHPDTTVSGKRVDGGSFSRTDIDLMVKSGASEVRAVTKDYIYSAKPKIFGGSNFSRRAVDFANSRFDGLRKELSKQVHSGKLKRSDFATEFMHRLWTDVANEGLIYYTREKRK